MKKIILSLIFCFIGLNCMAAASNPGGSVTPGTGGDTTDVCGEDRGRPCANQNTGVLTGTYQPRNNSGTLNGWSCMCVATDCYPEYDLYNERCYKLKQPIDCNYCPSSSQEQIVNADDCEQSWNTTTHQYGDCYPRICNNTSHKSEINDKIYCVPNTISCDCTQTYEQNCKKDWDEDSDAFGDCYPTDCDPGYTLLNKACKVCLDDQTESCTNEITHSFVAKKTCSDNTWGNCILESCVNTYHKQGNSCISDTQSCSCSKSYERGCQKDWDTASEDFGDCYPTDCDPGYTLLDKACKQDTVCLDDQTKNCTDEITNSSVAKKTCSNNTWGNCILELCDNTYHKQGNSCISDTQSCSCSKSYERGCQKDWDTASEDFGDCYPTGCKDYYHLIRQNSNITCEFDYKKYNFLN